MNPVIIALKGYEKIAKCFSGEKEDHLISAYLTEKQFPDGERYHKFNIDLKGRHVIIVGGTYTDANTLDMFDLGWTAVKRGASQLSLVIPYFGYSTMERACEPGEVVKAKTRCVLLSAIPQAPFGNTVHLLDLHAEGMEGFFEGPIRTEHIYAKDVILKEILLTDDPVIGSADASRAKWIESYALEARTDVAVIIKRRMGDSKTEVTGVSADVTGRNVVIYDDMLRTCGTAAKAVKKYLEMGAKTVRVVATHGVFTTGTDLKPVLKLISAGATSVAVTDSHPNASSLVDEWYKNPSLKNQECKLKVLAVGPMLRKAILGQSKTP